MILLSATPHDGSARSFASLMSLLDPTAISDPDDYTPEDYQHKGLVVRRFKKDIRDQVSEDFQERITEQTVVSAHYQDKHNGARWTEYPQNPSGHYVMSPTTNSTISMTTSWTHPRKCLHPPTRLLCVS